jgi:hypothetical protein
MYCTRAVPVFQAFQTIKGLFVASVQQTTQSMSKFISENCLFTNEINGFPSLLLVLNQTLFSLWTSSSPYFKTPKEWKSITFLGNLIPFGHVTRFPHFGRRQCTAYFVGRAARFTRHANGPQRA